MGLDQQQSMSPRFFVLPQSTHLFSTVIFGFQRLPPSRVTREERTSYTLKEWVLGCAIRYRRGQLHWLVAYNPVPMYAQRRLLIGKKPARYLWTYPESVSKPSRTISYKLFVWRSMDEPFWTANQPSTPNKTFFVRSCISVRLMQLNCFLIPNLHSVVQQR